MGVNHWTGRGGEHELRTTDGAGIGFGMEAPASGVGVFLLTLRAHREAPHGGIGTIVRELFQ